MGVGLPATYFYDSYAVLAFTSGHSGYRKYFEEYDGVLSKLNLLEIFYKSLEQHGARAASNIIGSFSKYLVEFGLEEIADSMKLRLELKRGGRNLSYADAVGYSLSRKMAIKFLTGERAFRGLSGVEYLE
jgi:hypothetical protein